jgi:hypothetical protein
MTRRWRERLFNAPSGPGLQPMRKNAASSTVARCWSHDLARLHECAVGARVASHAFVASIQEVHSRMPGEVT